MTYAWFHHPREKKLMRPSHPLFLTLIAAIGGLISGCQQPPKLTQIDLDSIPNWKLGEVQQTYKISSVLDSGPGTLREAIELANNSPGTDKIIFTSEDGLYSKPQTIFLKSPLPEITDNIFIDGYIENMLWKASGVTIDGANKFQIFTITKEANVKIKHLNIANGHGKKGGGILAEGSLVVASTTFMSNQAEIQGGAIFTSGALTIVYNSTFYKNQAEKGGAMFSAGRYSRITNSTFSENSGTSGSAIFNESHLQMNNVLIAQGQNGADCNTSTPLQPMSSKNIIANDGNCGHIFTTNAPKLRAPGLYNGPVFTIPISGKTFAINWGDQHQAVDEHGNLLQWDQRGNGDPRFAAELTDIGAFESQPQMKMVVDTYSGKDIRWCSSYAADCSFIGAITIASRSKRLNKISFDENTFKDHQEIIISEKIPNLPNKIYLDASNLKSKLIIKAPSPDDKSQINNIDLENIEIIFE